jgi:hypothetical protein
MKKTFANSMILVPFILMDLLAGMEFDIFVSSVPALQKKFSLSPLLNGVMNVSVAAAPVLGSYLTLYFHWLGMMTMFFVIKYWEHILTAAIAIPVGSGEYK